jgi:hypothetical protein
LYYRLFGVCLLAPLPDLEVAQGLGNARSRRKRVGHLALQKISLNQLLTDNTGKLAELARRLRHHLES